MKYLLLCLLLTSCTSFHIENDIFDPFNKNKDKYYTNGIKISNVTEENNTQTSYAVGQNIYTPSKKKADADPAILNKDRPYTGWLYGEYLKNIKEDNVQNTYLLQAGCTGRCSFAKEVQQNFHKLINQDIPTWDRDYSLKSEPGLVLGIQQTRTQYENKFDIYDTDFNMYGSGRVGNIIDSGAVGINARFGYQLPEFTPSEIIVKTSKVKPYDYSLYLFGRAEQRYVLYNHFLDGSLFQNERHTVDSKDFVNEGQLGISVGYGVFKITYTFVSISDEWKDQNGRVTFGAIDFNW